MDEVGGWLVNRKLQTAGQTVQLAMRYRKPVPTGENITIEIRGRIKEMKRNLAFIEASLSYDGEICSTCEMTYYCFPKDSTPVAKARLAAEELYKLNVSESRKKQ